MTSKHVSRATRLRLMQMNAGYRQLGLIEIDRAVDSLLQPLGNSLLHLLCLRLILLQAREPRLPFRQFSVG